MTVYTKLFTPSLSSALNGINHPILGSILLGRVQVWAPKTLNFSDQLYEVLGTWGQASDLLSTLKRGLTEQTRWGQRPAARALAKAFGGNEEVQQWLIGILNGTTDLQTTGAAIEALILGWPSADGLEQAIADAGKSLKPSLQLIAIWAMVKLEEHTESHLSELLELLGEPCVLDYRDRQLAAEALSSAWSNHPRVIERCIQSAQRYGRVRGALDSEMSIDFLLGCSIENQSIRRWIVDELKGDHPFILSHESWDRLAPFAQVDDTIKESLVVAITNKTNVAFDYKITGLISALKDPRLKSFAIQKVRSTDAISSTWYLHELLNGWPLDQDVLNLVAEIRVWPDEKLAELVQHLPKILPNRQECRSRLLALHRSRESHFLNTYPVIFASIGCDSTDQEVVDELVKAAKSNRFWGGTESLIINFSANPLVQSLARERLLERDPPLVAIAKAYSGVPDLRANVLNRIGALPTSLRYILTEVASIECGHHVVMSELLSHYDWEVDVDLKVLLSIRHHEHLNSSKINVAKAIETLLANVKSVGPDLEERRAAAVAGLITLGAMKEFANLRDGDRPLAIHVGGYDHESGALLELIAQRWDELQSQLGEGFVERIGRHFSTVIIWDALAPYLAWNERLRQDFVSYCELENASLGIPSLRALARERPNSELLERHCLFAVENTQSEKVFSPRAANALAFEAAYILRNQFGGKPDISDRLNDSFAKLRIPRHSATHSSNIRPLIPRPFGRVSRSEATQV